jgi:hypothetical protein
MVKSKTLEHQNCGYLKDGHLSSIGSSLVEFALVLVLSIPLLTGFIDVGLSLYRNTSFAFFIDKATREVAVSAHRCELHCLEGNPRPLLSSNLQQEFDRFLSRGADVRLQKNLRSVRISGSTPVVCFTCGLFDAEARYNAVSEMVVDFSACSPVSCSR